MIQIIYCINTDKTEKKRKYINKVKSIVALFAKRLHAGSSVVAAALAYLGKKVALWSLTQIQ